MSLTEVLQAFRMVAEFGIHESYQEVRIHRLIIGQIHWGENGECSHKNGRLNEAPVLNKKLSQP